MSMCQALHLAPHQFRVLPVLLLLCSGVEGGRRRRAGVVEVPPAVAVPVEVVLGAGLASAFVEQPARAAQTAAAAAVDSAAVRVVRLGFMGTSFLG